MTTSPQADASPRRVLRDPILFAAFGFGSGLSSKAPGTVGTLVGILFVLAFAVLPNWAYLLVTALLFVFGIWLCELASRKLGVHDHGGIVWDEIVGLMITMIAVPISWWTLLAGFVLFRFFDILKPWPVKVADKRIGGGFGIMVDDLLAGLYALLVLHGLLWLWG